MARRRLLVFRAVVRRGGARGDQTDEARELLGGEHRRGLRVVTVADLLHLAVVRLFLRRGGRGGVHGPAVHPVRLLQRGLHRLEPGDLRTRQPQVLDVPEGGERGGRGGRSGRGGGRSLLRVRGGGDCKGDRDRRGAEQLRHRGNPVLEREVASAGLRERARGGGGSASPSPTRRRKLFVRGGDFNAALVGEHAAGAESG